MKLLLPVLFLVLLSISSGFEDLLPKEEEIEVCPVKSKTNVDAAVESESVSVTASDSDAEPKNNNTTSDSPPPEVRVRRDDPIIQRLLESNGGAKRVKRYMGGYNPMMMGMGGMGGYGGGFMPSFGFGRGWGFTGPFGISAGGYRGFSFG